MKSLGLLDELRHYGIPYRVLQVHDASGATCVFPRHSSRDNWGRQRDVETSVCGNFGPLEASSAWR